MRRFAVVSGDSGQAVQFARQHPEEFEWSQSDAAYFYTAYHFRELVRRFPKNELAEEAAYLLAEPVQGGECEGDVVCAIESSFYWLNAFLVQYPNSIHAPDAVRRVDEAFTSALADQVANPDDSEELDTGGIDSLLHVYSSTVAGLPDSLRLVARAAIDSARRMLDSLAPSRSQGLASDTAGAPSRGAERLAARSAMLPAELDSVAAAHGCASVVDGYHGRPYHLRRAFVYGVLPGPRENSAAFWCQRGTGDPERTFWLVLMHRGTRLDCADEMKKEDPPAPFDLSLEPDSLVPLKDFWDPTDRTWSPPAGATTAYRPIRDYSDGLEFLYYCYHGRWLQRLRE